MIIKLLSNSTINKISAGEVIERPSSVVKELVENSIDAGSTKIEVTLECAGKNLIVIKDNGIGMRRDEMELAIERHATSKLDEDDLLNINSFGFRGEALPSIAAISKFKITSRKRGSREAYCLAINGGVMEPIVEVSADEGTIIEVRDLFFATPARLKFLRTDKTELAASVQILKRIALAHPHIAFTLIHDRRDLIKIRPHNNNQEENIKNRISEIISAEFVENAEIVVFERDGIKIHGYTSLPTYNRASAEDQFLFINNRPVKDKILNIALRVAYQDYLARDRHPIAALFLNISPYFVDVNVHPAKTEVRFHDPNLIKNVFISAIRGALNNSSNRVSNVPAASAINYMQKENMRPQTPIYNRETGQGIANFNERNNSGGSFQMPIGSKTHNAPRYDYSLLLETKPHSIILEEKIEPKSFDNFPLGAAKAQLHGTYIISQTDDSIIITDQHAAHERIGYENIKAQIAKNGLIKQRLLIPEIVELPDENRADLINDNKEALAKLGLTIEKFGEKSIIVSEMPSLVGDVNPSQIIADLADYLLEFGENIVLTDLIEHVTETYACHYAIRAGRKLSADEMNGLLRQMENTPFSGQCNHGRQTYVKLKLSDIEKLFGRK